MSAAENSAAVPPNAGFNRPGVSDAFLLAAGCHHVGEDDCGPIYGFKTEGIAIPFWDVRGAAVMDGDSQFARVRLYHETDSQKYYQRRASCVHVYIPPGFKDRLKGSTLILVEGEFKALALDETGYCVLGLCGINGAARTLKQPDGEISHELHDELLQLIEFHRPATIVFAGDADVALNSQFAFEAVKLRRLICGSKQFSFVEKVILVKPPVDGDKGVDDCRAAQGENFNPWFDAMLADGFEVEAKATPVEIFCALLRREQTAIQKMLTPETGDAHRQRIRLLNSAAQLQHEPAAMFSLRPLLAEILSIKESKVPGLIRDAACSNLTKAKNKQVTTKQTRGKNDAEHVTPAQWFNKSFPSISGEHGDAIREEMDKNGIVTVRDIGEDFLAATFGDKGSPDAPTVFMPLEDKFYTYRPAEGIFIQQRDPVLVARLSRLLLDCARQCRDSCQTEALEFRLRDSAGLNGVLKKARGLLEAPHDYFSADLTEYIPCANGMLRLKDRVLMPFNPSYRRRNKLAVSYDPAAKCPLFLDTLMRPALDDDDLELLQRWCGLSLIGENLAQVILILTGTAGGGKGTFIRVLNGIIGQNNLASLRTQLLGERFELGRFLGKTLLYGATEDFLDQHGASVLKSLTGYDPMTLEFKNSNETPSIICRFNVIVTCNSRLTVHLEGDAEAWRRRLRIIEYHKPKPEKVIVDLDKLILGSEAGGVLNWTLDGLDKIRADRWQLHPSSLQQATVDNLLLASDGHAVFARESLKRDASQSLTVPDCFAAYVEFCNQRGWTALTRNKFGALIGDVVIRQFGVPQSHNVPDSYQKPQRGWRGITFCKNSSQPGDKTVSQVSQCGPRDGWDATSPPQIANSFADREEAMLL